MKVVTLLRWMRKLSLMVSRSGAERIAMSVQRSVPVGQKATATMLEVNGELLLLGVTSANVTLIQRWEKRMPIRGTVQ